MLRWQMKSIQTRNNSSNAVSSIFTSNHTLATAIYIHGMFKLVKFTGKNFSNFC